MRPAIRGGVSDVSDMASLKNLSDIVEPADITGWPPAPGLVLIALLILLWSSFIVLLWWQRHQRNAYRRAALQELDEIKKRIRHPETRTEGIRLLSVLLKRVAIAAYPRTAVASLTGDRWNAFLDRQIDDDTFSDGQSKLLAMVMVDPDPGAHLTPSDCQRLIQAVQHWIKCHRVKNSIFSTVGTGM